MDMPELFAHLKVPTVYTQVPYVSDILPSNRKTATCTCGKFLSHWLFELATAEKDGDNE